MITGFNAHKNASNRKINDDRMADGLERKKSYDF